MDFYGSYRVQTNGKFASVVLVVLSSWDLDTQQRFFKLTMKSNASQAMGEVVALVANKVNPQIVNPLTRLWNVINVSHLVPYLSEVFKVSRDCYDACLGIHWGWMMLQFYFISKKQVAKLLKSTFVVGCSYVCTIFFALDTFPYAMTFESWGKCYDSY